jgi:DNA-binding CsgD family transcriptional regulator
MYRIVLLLLLNASLLGDAAKDIASQHFDSAMEKAITALEVARADENHLLEVQALSTIVGVDIMTSRDADAWEKALEAEAIAREYGYREELSAILISKAKLCSYAEISPETGRNDEGLEYANEALALAQDADVVEQQCEACYVIASLYINKNRWNNPIDADIYRTAGEFLDRGQALADTYDLPRLKRNGILFRSRWFQQGDRNEEAIKYFEQVRTTLNETDHLTVSALDDRLVRLYTRTGDSQKALDTHDDYVFHIQKYIQQKEDETLQEMETRFEVQEKERKLERNRYQIAVLVLALLLAVTVITVIGIHLKKARRRNEELRKISDSRAQIIKILSGDINNRNAEDISADVTKYVDDILLERSKRIADIGLSQREIQIIRLSAEGLTAAEIAERTYLSVHTVNTHRRRIYSKMDVRNVADLIHKATELGIL